MEADPGPVRVVGSIPSANDQFYMAWAKDSLKATGPALNDTLQRILVLDTALIGGGFVAAKGDVIPAGWSVPVLLLLGASLGFALWGVSPRGGLLNLHDPDGIREFVYGAIRRKAWAMNRSMLALAAAFVVALAGVTWAQLRAAPTPSAPPASAAPVTPPTAG